MTRRLISGVVVGLLAAALAGGAAAQPKAASRGYVPGTAGCDAKDCAYVIDSWGNKDNNVVKSGNYGGEGNLCWRTGYWTPQMAIAACDPDLVPKPTPVAAQAPAPAPAAPPPAAAAPKVQKITLAS